MSKVKIANEIDAEDLWKGIGGHFDSLNQILHEIIDNSISNFRANGENLNHRTITIQIDTEKHGGDFVEITIEDTGTGISDVNAAFRLGDRSKPNSPLNEHGFGLKHALASANPENDGWAVYIRNEEFVRSGKVLIVEAPFELVDFEGEVIDFNLNSYPTILNNHSTGTIVRFKTSREMYRSLGRFGAKDAYAIAYYLKEDLGFIYSNLISENTADIQIVVNNGPKINVSAVVPFVEKTVLPGEKSESVDLGMLGGGAPTGEVTLNYKFNVIFDRNPTVDGGTEKVVYYKANMKSSGVEIRINGRMIKNNILTEIWPQQEQHNRFNNFLVRIDIVSNNKEALPKTRSSKNGFRQGDIRLAGLYRWIYTKCPTPYENKYKRDEIHLFEELKDIKEKQLGEVFGDGITVKTNRRVLQSSRESLTIDLFVAYHERLFIYLGKKSSSVAIDLYRLKLYWDACVLDGLQPTNAILLCPEHSPTVQDLVNMTNSLKDLNGRPYNVILRKWRDEGIDFPNAEMS